VNNTEPEYLDIDTASRVLGIAKATLYKWISLGKIGREQGFRKVGRLVKFQRAALIEAIESGALRS